MPARSIARFKAADELPELAGLPDPFLMEDGGVVSSVASWQIQRRYLKDMLAHYLYGHMPSAPAQVSGVPAGKAAIYGGRAIEEHHTVLCGGGADTPLRFRLRLVYPAGAAGFPVIIKNSGDLQADHCPIEREAVVGRGYALALFDRTDLAPDSEAYGRHVSAAYPGWDWKAIAIWAWGCMRALDYLQSAGLPAYFTKTCVTGHSRGGKAALCAGIYDERFAVVAPNGSGCGGTGCLRVLGDRNGRSQNPLRTESVGRIAAVFPHWWTPAFASFGGGDAPHNIMREARLPFDAHTLRALIAPRVCLSTEGWEDDWANPYGTQLCWQAAQPVYGFLGADGNNLLHVREGGHAQNDEDWRALLDCCDMAFFGKPPSAAFNRPRFDISFPGYGEPV